MQKRKSWQLFLILAVIALTIYNILPTIFYYTKPLKSPIDEKRATAIESSITKRVNSLENGSVDWIYSFCHLLKIKPTTVEIDPQNSGQIIVSFPTKEAASLFRTYLPRSGALIPFTPSQLS